jgi:predicted dinucleotide-binding enzyme
VRRVIVVGAGFFGRLVAQRLRAAGVTPLIATRRGADLQLDAEEEGSLLDNLSAGDVVVDTAGPFSERTTRLVRSAIDAGCDVVDIAESLGWSEAVLALSQRAAATGSRLFPACSAVAAIAGACVNVSGMEHPETVDVYIAPASAETASPATVRGMTASIGRPVRTLRDGRMTIVPGYRDQRAFPASSRIGGLVESAASVLLPQSWPSIQRAEFWVDPNTLIGQEALAFAARVPPLAAIVRALGPRIGAAGLGRRNGVFAVELHEGARALAYVFSAPRRSYLIAVEPAVLAAEALARGGTYPAGVVLPHAQVAPAALFARLRSLGIEIKTPAL